MAIKKNKKCEGEDEFKKTKSLKNFPGMVEIVPLKDFLIHHNQFHIEIKEGVPVSIPQKFLQNMVTENVIKEIPKS
jgi:hypothetical protein